MKLLVVGWDAATFSHVQKFDLPFHDSLDYSGRLQANDPFGSAGYISSANAWTTLTTGARFDDHRLLGFIYDKMNTDSITYSTLSKISTFGGLPWPIRRILIDRIIGITCSPDGVLAEDDRHISSVDVPFKRLWDLLPCKSIVYGCPLTYPAPDIDGALVSGIPHPRPETADSPLTHPPDIHSQIFDGRHQGYQTKIETPNRDPTTDIEDFLAEQYERSRLFADDMQYLYEEVVPDAEFGFLMLRFLDAGLHATDDEDLIRKSYEIIDETTADVVNRLDPDAVLLLSDHGMAFSWILQQISIKVGDHDAANGMWAASEDFQLDRHGDVVPAILNEWGVNTELPVPAQVSQEDTDQQRDIHEHLEDLGYA